MSELPRFNHGEEPCTEREFIQAITKQALRYYDVEGDKTQAVLSFISDLQKHDNTRKLTDDSDAFVLLWAAAHEGREQLEQAMLGFAPE